MLRVGARREICRRFGTFGEFLPENLTRSQAEITRNANLRHFSLVSHLARFSGKTSPNAAK